MYGDLSHANEKKEEILNQWMSYPLMDTFFRDEFVKILGSATYIIAYVQDLNEEVIKELSEKK